MRQFTLIVLPQDLEQKKPISTDEFIMSDENLRIKSAKHIVNESHEEIKEEDDEH